MNKVRRKFVIFAEITVFVLLTVLMSVINIINFTMVSEDADLITQKITDQSIERYTHSPDYPKKEEKEEDQEEKTTATAAGIPDRPFGGDMGLMGPMGPDSPEMNSSLRYFTIAFDKDGNATTLSYNISALSETEAQELAKSLIGQGKTGWTCWTYRYRVKKHDGIKYVTVIDQGRELLPCFRLLYISAAGGLVLILLSFIILRFVGKWLFKPLEEADRKQKQFIRSIENDFRMPLTVINANTELLERKNGASEETGTIDRQVRRMTKLVKNLSSLSIYEEKDLNIVRLNLSDLMLSSLDRKKKRFEEKSIELITDIEPDIFIEADEEAIKSAVGELIANSLKFAEGKAEFSLKKNGGRIVLTQKNPVSLQNGSADQVFDRFVRLDNAKDKDGAGIGLSQVKDIIKLSSGRVGARIASGEFILRIDL